MRLVTVEPIIFVYVFASALIQPLLQQYIYSELSKTYNFTKGEEEKVCVNGTNAGHNITKLENLVHTQTSHWFLVINICTCVPSVVTTLLIGSWSDIAGRKPVLFIALTGAFVRCLIISLTVTFGFPFYVVFIGSFVEGLTGSFAAIMGSCFAYIVDITENKSRSFRLGLLEISILVGATASFFVSGVWLKSSGYEQPFWAGTGILLICGLYVAFFLPESLQSRNNIRGFSPLLQLKKVKDFMLAKRAPYVNTCLILLSISFLFAVFDYYGNVTVIYTKHSPLCWSSELIGYYMAATTASGGLGIVFALKILGKVFSDSILVIISCLSFLTSNLVVGFANTTTVIFLAVIPAFLAGVAPACMRSIASKMVQSSEEGTLCSVLAVTEALSQVLAPLMFNLLYPIGLTKLQVKGFVYFCQAGVLLIPVTLFSIICCLTSKNKHILYGLLEEENLPVQA